jgi:hypothetical protein
MPNITAPANSIDVKNFFIMFLKIIKGLIKRLLNESQIAVGRQACLGQKHLPQGLP